MEILNVKVEKETLEKLQSLVKKKMYKNKSEAVRKMLEEHLEEHPELFTSDGFQEIFKEASENMSDQQFEKLSARVFSGSKTAAQIVAEDRER
jgi:Arc/MetJ-type ribon-helix-helix transcriptional regulator